MHQLEAAMFVRKAINPAFDEFLDRALLIARRIEGEYLDRSYEPNRFPRSVSDFLKIALSLFPEARMTIRMLNLSPPHPDIREAVLFSRSSQPNLLVLPSASSDQAYFPICRAEFEVIFHREFEGEMLPHAKVSLIDQLDNSIMRSWENILTESIREMVPTTLVELLADIAATEFLFPYRERLKVLAQGPDMRRLGRIASQYHVPEGIVRYYLHPALIEIFRGMKLLTPPN